MAKIKLTQQLDYVQGYLCNGHKELIVDKEHWDSLSDDDKRNWFNSDADIVVDDYEVEDYDCSSTSEIEEELV